MKIKYFSWIPAAIIMTMIFTFSAKPAVSSNESSLLIVKDMINIYQTVTDAQLPTDQRVKLENDLNFIVRKTAHFSEYALLAFAVAFHLAVLKRKGRRLYLMSIIISFVYAATDEFHQLYVPGRSGMIRDVLIDTSGAVIGTLLFALIISIQFKRRKTKETKPLV